MCNVLVFFYYGWPGALSGNEKSLGNQLGMDKLLLETISITNHSSFIDISVLNSFPTFAYIKNLKFFLY